MRIACLIDTFGKVQHNRIELIKRHIPAAFEVFLPRQKFNSNEFDVIYYANAGLYEQKKVDHPRLCASITSHKTYKDLHVFGKISVNNNMLYDEYIKKHKKVVYIPNGVETDIYRFAPLSYASPFRIGWVGNSDRKVKNFSILQKLMKRFDDPQLYKFDIVASSKTDSAKKLFSLKKMVPYYQRLHYFLVLSDSEGTPNPALEAGSCGVPLISSHVGNMPQLINSENGWIAPRKADIYDFVSDRLSRLTEISAEGYSLIRQNIRKEIDQNWKWEYRMSLFRDFFLQW